MKKKRWIHCLAILGLLVNLCVIVSFFFAFSQTAAISQNRPQPQRYVLDNGMTVILEEIHTAPVVALQVWVRAGSITEGEYSGSGISHYIEHMLFKGTEKRGVGEINREIRGLGGQINAYASFDRTVYHLIVPSEHFVSALDVLSDAVMNSAFDPEELKKEREVILREIDMGEDDPDRFLGHLFWPTVYREHPYRYPVIGYRTLFEQLTREDLLDYYSKMYCPNNVILVGVGDFDSEIVLSHIKKTFANFKRGSLPPVYIPSEPDQLGLRRVEKEFEVKQIYLLMGFRTVSIESKDMYPLDVLAIILGQGRSSRLFRKIREEKGLVNAISSWSYTPRYTGIFGIRATLDEVNKDRAIEEILKELDQFKGELVIEEELEKAKRKVVSEHIFSRETMKNRATDLASNELVVGDVNFSQTYIRQIQKVDREDIKRVANKYFYRDNLTITLLKPAIEKVAARPKISLKKPPLINKYELSNGMTLLVRENHTLPTVFMQAVFKGGLRFENEENNGIGEFTRRMLLKGTRNRTAQKIADGIESLGGAINTYGGNNSFGCSVSLLREDFDTGLEILTDVIMNPIFPSEEIERERRIILAQIKAQEDDIFDATFKLFKQTLFVRHPFKFQRIGLPQSIARITRADLIKHYNEFFTPNNMVLAIYGDVKASEVVGKVEKAFSNFESRPLPLIKIPQELKPTRIRVARKYMERKQAIIMLGFQGIDVKSEDRYTFEVMTSILSGGGSRLYQNIRGQLGLAYSVGSFSFIGLDDPGAYIFYIATAPEKVEIAKDALLEEIKKLTIRQVSNEELNRAKKNLIGTEMIHLETNQALAFQCVLDELYGLGYQNFEGYASGINKVTKEDIRKVATKYFELGSYTMVIVGPNM
ncbi:insulinase family protein [Patescibacteria group bacterium]|nr:insulinase family protein [Patescibacteria group bacterium]